MVYTIYNTSTGAILKCYSGPDNQLEQNVPADHSAIVGQFDDSSFIVDLATRLPIPKPVDTAAAIAQQSMRISEIRDTLRDSDVTLTAGYSVQADRDSVLMMQETIDRWADITHMRTPDGRQLWKMADNSVHAFTQAEFSAFVAEVRQRRAQRMDVNFAYAEVMKAQLPLPDNHAVFDSTTWPGQL